MFTPAQLSPVPKHRKGDDFEYSFQFVEDEQPLNLSNFDEIKIRLYTGDTVIFEHSTTAEANLSSSDTVTDIVSGVVSGEVMDVGARRYYIDIETFLDGKKRTYVSSPFNVVGSGNSGTANEWLITITNSTDTATGERATNVMALAVQAKVDAESARDETQTLKDSIEWKREFDATTTYAKDNRVSYLGSSFISLQDSNTGNTPSDGSEFWDVIAEKGDKGEDGIQNISDAGDVDLTGLQEGDLLQAVDDNGLKLKSVDVEKIKIPSEVTVFDAFNRADGALGISPTGHGWSVLGNILEPHLSGISITPTDIIISNKIARTESSASGRQGHAVINSTPVINTDYYKIDSSFHGQMNRGGTGFILSYVDENNFIGALGLTSGRKCIIYQVKNGVYTELASSSVLGVVVNTNSFDMTAQFYTVTSTLIDIDAVIFNQGERLNVRYRLLRSDGEVFFDSIANSGNVGVSISGGKMNHFKLTMF